MNISSVNSLTEIMTPTAFPTPEANSTASPQLPSDSASVSRFATLMSELQQLQQSNPSQFKAVTAQISSQLVQSAKSANGNQAQAISAIASAFQEASSSGGMPSLQTPSANPNDPQGQTGKHHHHHHHAYTATQVDSSTSTPSSIEQALASLLSAS